MYALYNKLHSETVTCFSTLPSTHLAQQISYIRHPTIPEASHATLAVKVISLHFPVMELSLLKVLIAVALFSHLNGFGGE